MRPSSLPMLAQCPSFVGEGGEYADTGTLRHKLLANQLKQVHRTPADVDEMIALLQALDDEDVSGVDWAENYIRLHAPMADYPLVTEHHVNPLDENFNPIFDNGGTLDYACGSELFDFKWRERDYSLQMAAYALGWMQEIGRDQVNVHVMFGATKHAAILHFTAESARAKVNEVLDGATNQAGKTFTPCDYCGWCSRALTCPALLKKAQTVATGYSEEPRAKSWHPSEMKTGEELADSLWIWRTVLKKWGESIEYHALDAAEKRGLTLPGFELATKAGRSYCTDVPAAHAQLGIPQEETFKACDLRMNTSKKYPDKKGIIDVFAAFHGMKKAVAKRDVLSRLEAVIKKTKDSVTLRATKSTDDDNNEDE